MEDKPISTQKVSSKSKSPKITQNLIFLGTITMIMAPDLPQFCFIDKQPQVQDKPEKNNRWPLESMLPANLGPEAQLHAKPEIKPAFSNYQLKPS